MPTNPSPPLTPRLTQIDAHTVEVADYTVVVKGLPEVDPIEVRGGVGWGCWLAPRAAPATSPAPARA
jgi:hypothetical protein